jgi:hypothetical protein
METKVDRKNCQVDRKNCFGEREYIPNRYGQWIAGLKRSRNTRVKPLNTDKEPKA